MKKFPLLFFSADFSPNKKEKNSRRNCRKVSSDKQTSKYNGVNDNSSQHICRILLNVLKYLPAISWATNVRGKMRQDKFESLKTEYTKSLSYPLKFPLKT